MQVSCYYFVKALLRPRCDSYPTNHNAKKNGRRKKDNNLWRSIKSIEGEEFRL